MDFSVNNKISFTARNKTIRFADDIARNVNKEFPRVSNSLIEGMDCVQSDKFFKLLINYSALVGSLRYMQAVAFKTGRSFEDKLVGLINPIKKLRVGNCSEASEISTFVARVNGLENAQMRHLTTPDGDSYDHVVTYVPDKKPYIIDAWLGFADYVPNAIKRYQKEYARYFDFEGMGSSKIVCDEIKPGFSLVDFVNSKLTLDELETVKRTYPEMLLKNSK